MDENKNALIIFYITLSIILILFGGSHFYTKTLLVFLSLIIFATLKKEIHLPKHIKISFVFIFLLMLLQLIPLPYNLLKTISPGTYEKAIKPLENIGLIIGEGFHTISIYPANTFFYISILFSVYVFYLVGYEIISKEKDNYKFFIVFSFLTSIFILLTEITQRIFGCKKIYCFTLIRKGHFGQFINSNFAADFMSMVLILVFSYAVSRTDNKKRTTYIMLSSIIFITILITLSRAAILLSTALIIIFIIKHTLSLKTGFSGKTALIISLATITILIEIFLINPQHIIKEIDTVKTEINNPAVRKNINLTTLEVFKHFPIFGSGLDTFREISPAYQHLNNKIWITYSDMDLLQFLAEGGLILISIIFYLLVSSILFKKGKKFPSYYSMYISGIEFALIFMILHSFVAYPFYFPLTLLYFFTILGIRDGFIVRKQIKTRNQPSKQNLRI